MPKKEKPAPITIDGKDILAIYTIGSMYANGFIRIQMKDHTEHRMHVDNLLPLLTSLSFTGTMKSKYYHLTPAPITK